MSRKARHLQFTQKLGIAGIRKVDDEEWVNLQKGDHVEQVPGKPSRRDRFVIGKLEPGKRFHNTLRGLGQIKGLDTGPPLPGISPSPNLADHSEHIALDLHAELVPNLSDDRNMMAECGRFCWIRNINNMHR